MSFGDERHDAPTMGPEAYTLRQECRRWLAGLQYPSSRPGVGYTSLPGHVQDALLEPLIGFVERKVQEARRRAMSPGE